MADDPDATLAVLVEMSRATDESLRAKVRRLAPKIILQQTRRGLPTFSGVARRRVRPAANGGDLDLDRSMDRIVGARAEGRGPRLDELQAGDWARPELALCLVIDRSGSMHGERLTMAAVTAGACATIAPWAHAVLAFSTRVEVLKGMSVRRPAHATVEEVLTLRGRGTTALAVALDEARRQLDRAPARRKVTLLLSDCRATEQPEALTAAGQTQELIILAPADDVEAAEQLARAAGGTWAPLSSLREVSRSLNHLLADGRL